MSTAWRSLQHTPYIYGPSKHAFAHMVALAQATQHNQRPSPGEQPTATSYAWGVSSLLFGAPVSRARLGCTWHVACGMWLGALRSRLWPIEYKTWPTTTAPNLYLCPGTDATDGGRCKSIKAVFFDPRNVWKLWDRCNSASVVSGLGIPSHVSHCGDLHFASPPPPPTPTPLRCCCRLSLS